MSEILLKVGCRVQVPAKSVKGTVEYIGNTAFAQGKWVGINLDEPKGKNNGTVKDKQYFKCEENHGMFVRQSQLVILGDNDTPVLDLTEEAAATPKSKSSARLSTAASNRRKPSPVAQQAASKRPDQSSSRLSLTSVTSSPSREDLSGSTSSLSTPQPTSLSKRASSFVEKSPASKLPKHVPTRALGKAGSGVQGKLASASASKSRSQSKDRVSTDDNTGFVETLNPQFTPGQLMLSPGPQGPAGLAPGVPSGINMAGGTSNISLLQQEMENLRDQLKDLGEKYETLKVKRLQDKEKLKDYDKTKMQMDQLIEFKSKIMESQSSLQRELQQAKKDARDAIEAKNAHEDEMSDLAETVEMATLDKEMAEEKAESLQQELQEARDKLEEVTLDYETLKAELEGGGGGEGGGVKVQSSYETKQLEQQNVRLRDSLVKMRDFIAHDKHEYQKLQKELDQKKSEIAELSRTKEKLSTMVEVLEEQVADLHEQVDAALGAEEMVETLGSDKMTLQERVSELEEMISDLEEIQETNDQLLEEQKDMDLELKEELDQALSSIREAQREKDAALENLNDREQTIVKFREHAANLEEQVRDLKARLEAETNKPVSFPEMLDFKKVFSETKAHKRAIDLELRQMELKQKEQHVLLLKAFMPDSFMARGGDHDAILLLLLLPRLLWKCDILIGQIRDKFPSVEPGQIQRGDLVKGDAVVQFACRCRLSYYLYTFQTILHQLVYGLDTCGAETLLKAGSKYPEMAAQERTLDSYIELMKKDQLDENIVTEPLEKGLFYWEAVRGSVLEAGHSHQAHCIRDWCQAVTSACQSVLIDTVSINVMISGGDQTGEAGLLTQYMSANLEVCLQQLKSTRRRIPAEESDLNLSDNQLSKLLECCRSTNKLIKTWHEVAKGTRQSLLLQGESESAAGVGGAKVSELLQGAVDKHLEPDEESWPDAVKQVVGELMRAVAEFNQLVDKTDFDLISPSKEKPAERPVMLRAALTRKELDETKVLAKRLETKEADIRELKMALKSKQEELSEMGIRKEMIDKKLTTINRDHDSEVAKLKVELEQARIALRTKEKDFEETMDHLQADIDQLEQEKGELKEKLKGYGGKKAVSDMPVGKLETGADKATSPPGRNWTTSSGETDPELVAEVQKLRASLKAEQLERFKLECELYRGKVQNLPPILAPRRDETDDEKESKKLMKELFTEGQSLKKEVLDNLVVNILDVSKVKPGEEVDFGSYYLGELERKKRIQDKVNHWRSRVTEQMVRSTRGGHIKTALKTFPTPELKKALEQTQPVIIGELRLPQCHGDTTPHKQQLLVDYESLKQIHDRLASLIA